MNIKSNKSGPNIPWKKIAMIVGVLVCVAVFSGRAGLEKMLGLKAGTLGTKVEEKPDDDSPNFNLDMDWKNSANKTDGDSGQIDKAAASNSGKPYLTKNGFVMESPEGLTYYIGDRGENRVDHVMRHAADDPSRRGSHGVFDGDENQIFRTIDEAYALVKAKSKQVINEDWDDRIKTRVAYDVDMRRKIGYQGGSTGSRKGKPSQTVIRLVLDKDIRVISAFPCK